MELCPYVACARIRKSEEVRACLKEKLSPDGATREKRGRFCPMPQRRGAVYTIRSCRLLIAAAVPAMVAFMQAPVNAQNTLNYLELSPRTVTGGNRNSTGTVALLRDATEDVTVELDSNDDLAATVPESVVIRKGTRSATFTATTEVVYRITQVRVTARLNRRRVSGNLTVLPALPEKVEMNPTRVVGGAANSTGTVTLYASVPAATTVDLSTNSFLVSVPASITIAAGATTGTFTATTSAVNTITTVTILATANGDTVEATLTVTPVDISSLTLSPTTVVGGKANSTGTVTLAHSAPQGGVTVSLFSSSAAASVPATVTIPAGAATGTFTVTTVHVRNTVTATITAASGGSRKTAGLTVQTD
ncbi:MAG TPA: hypothetical protein VGS41_17590 [Chthonomonadales bacterium]|nr:hypothetical protein [Chthonomonadales bacterium]